MKELNENGEYLDAVKAAQDMDKMSDYSPEIAALRNQIIRENREYFETQIDPAFENGDYYLIGEMCIRDRSDDQREEFKPRWQRIGGTKWLETAPFFV